jgi:N-acetylglucosamine PTS system EIICBA or EIICB component
MKRFFEATQQLGRALMLPIAVLPVAGLLLRLGQPDLMNMAPIAAAGDAIFGNLGLLFAIGVAVGLAKENHGAAGLAGVVGFLVASKATEVIIQVPPEVAAAAAALGGKSEALALAAHKAKELSKLSVPLGIISGVIAGWLYNRYSDIRLPSYLAFFGGRRFVPIAAGFAGLIVAFIFGYGWPVLVGGMDALSKAVMASGEFGLFVYGVLNRILIVTGLHHILNNVAWFIVGDFNGVTGDLKRFFAGDPTAGMFMSGFFPVMMFGLPAACLAMYHTALPDKKRAAGGLLMSMALTSFLTGVTEPIEFTFMFLAPVLYAIHAVLTGAAHVTMHLLGVKLGFGFSAGFFDYALNYKLSTHPLYLIPVGLVYFGIYYGIFRYCIVKLNLKTPGRETDGAPPVAEAFASGNAGVADGFIAALGGAANLTSVDACTTRLRLVLADRNLINEEALRQVGSRGVVKLGDHGLQVVLGPIADQIAGDIRARLAMPKTGNDADRTLVVRQPAANESGASTGPIPSLADLLAALGGRGNVLKFDAASGRLLLKVADVAAINEEALSAMGVRGVARPAPGSVHVLHPDAPALHRLLAS